MSKICLFIALFHVIFICEINAQAPNVLTTEEQEGGWRLLFDGKTFDGWRKLTDFGWIIKDGELQATTSAANKQRDIITEDQFGNFELYFEFKISKGTNSGVKYLVTNDYPEQKGAFLGLEYQILDDVNFKYPERGTFRSSSSLYDLIPADKKETKPLEEWNIARIVVKGDYIQHWLNDAKVLEYDKSTDAFRSLIMQSKYKDLKRFGKAKKGHILLQNEGTAISFRNLKIKNLN